MRFLLLSFCLLFCNFTKSQFQVAGDAVDIGNSCYSLTSNTQNQAGSFWHNSPIDLNYPFIVNFEAYFGCPFIFVDGGDGIAFVMQNTGSNLAPLGGGSLGYGGIANSIAVEFDTYSNNTIGDPSFDHVSVQQNGDISHNSSNCLVSPVAIDNNNPNIEDCNDHSFTITWDPSLNKLELFYNDAVSGSCYSVFSYLGDIVNNIFNGDSFVYWGFTGSTGSATNSQEVCVNSYENWSVPVENQYLCFYDSAWVVNNYSLNNVSWFNPVNNLLSSNDSVLIYNSQNTTYDYNYSDFCNSISFDQNFDLFVSTPVLSEDVSQHIDLSCFGSSDGQVSLNVINGFSPYSFSSDGSNFQNTGLFTNMNGGAIQITSLDSIGCVDSLQVNLLEPLDISISLSNVLNVQCDSFLSGNIDVMVSGGVQPYSFQWTGPNGYNSQNQNISGLNIGNYSLIVSDSNNCSSQVFDHLISFNNNISIDSVLSTNPLCFNDINGIIDISVSGGTQPYSFQWVGPGSFVSFDEDLTFLSAGNYNLIVQDIHGCFNDTIINLINPSPLSLSALTNNVVCNGDATGSIFLNPIGGTYPYSYNWYNNFGFQSNIQDIINIEAGDYSLNFIDDNGCYLDTNFIVHEPDLLTITLDSLEDVDCHGDSDGFLNVSVLGGSLPYFYQWTGPGGFSSSILNINNLSAGIYNLTVTDNNNCIELYQQDLLEGTEIDVNVISLENISCRGDNSGVIEINIFGGTGPYSCSWYSDSFYSIDQNINNLYAGIYDLNISDAEMCQNSFSFELLESSEVLEASITSTDACETGDLGSVEVDISGGESPYSLNWFGQNPNNLLPGIYEVLITDDFDCDLLLDYVIESYPQPEASFNVNNLIHVNEYFQFENMSHDYFYSNWNFGDGVYSSQDHPWHSYSDEGEYITTLTVSNLFGCIDSISYNINVFDDIYIYIPSAFTPNNDGVNDTFIVNVINYDNFKLSIYSRNGQNIFNSDDVNHGWNGTYNNNRCPLGEYVYMIKVLDIFGKEYVRKGKFLLCE